MKRLRWLAALTAIACLVSLVGCVDSQGYPLDQNGQPAGTPLKVDIGSGLSANVTVFTNNVTTLNDLNDVNVPSPSDGQVLSYDNATGEWIAANVTAGGPETDPVFGASAAAGIVGADLTNWDDAYGGMVHTWNGPLTYTIGGTVGIPSANATTDGYLTSADWNTFNAASGNVSGLVPYTGATNNVTLGGFTITAANIGNIAALNLSSNSTQYLDGSGAWTVPPGDTITSSTATNLTGLLSGNGSTVSGSWTLPAITAGGTVTISENVTLLLPTTLSGDGSFSGIAIGGTAGATLTFGQLVYYNSSSKWVLAKADAEATSGPVRLGICVLAAAADGNATTVLLWGKVNAAAAFPSLTVGAPAYISAASGGAIVTAAPSAAGNEIRIIGYGISADELSFQPDNTWIEHA